MKNISGYDWGLYQGGCYEYFKDNLVAQHLNGQHIKLMH